MRKLSGYGPSLIVLATAAVVLLAGPKIVQQLTYEQTKTRIVQARHSLESTDVLEQLNRAYGDVATVVEPSVVHVSAQYIEQSPFRHDRLGLSTGSGWVYDDLGHVVTNHHVIKDATRIDVQLHNGVIRAAQVIGSDPSTDVAVLKITSGQLYPATIADLNQPVNQGDLVFAFGSPFDFRFSMSAGVVSGKDRSVGVIRDDSGRRLGYENFIQVDAAINPGNSGGPLTDYRGRVIGMNTAIATGRRSSSSLEEGQFAGIGLAIPIDMIQPVVSQIIKMGYVEKGFLGVNVSHNNDDNARFLRQLGFSGSGVALTGVDEQGAAAECGVRAQDVVTHINSRPIATIAQLQSIVSSMRPGEIAKLTIWRYDSQKGSGSTLEIDVALKRLDTLRAAGELPPDQRRDSIVGLGILRMSTSTPLIARQLGVQHHAGVMIEEVAPGSELAQRIDAGSIIVEVEDLPVRNVEEFLRVLGDYDLRFPGVLAAVIAPDGTRAVVTLRVQ